jgi:cell division protein FtsW
MKKKSIKIGSAQLLLGLTILLTGLGTVFVFESSVVESFTTFNDQFFLLKQHLIGLGVGSIALIVALITPTQFWIKNASIWFILSLVLLLAVFIPGIGMELNGARRWLSFFGLRIQPVEFLKLAIVLYYSSWLSKHQRLEPFLLLTAVPIALILLQPDLGSALIIVGLAF